MLAFVFHHEDAPVFELADEVREKSPARGWQPERAFNVALQISNPMLDLRVPVDAPFSLVSFRRRDGVGSQLEIEAARRCRGNLPASVEHELSELLACGCNAQLLDP